ncbi:MAG: hypothetical protein Q4F24_17265 [Eubacteriales bacterium]|nr:hypothetical protein [Eubacteriales bacterium]
MAKQTKGYCKYCGKEYTKSGMLRHLASCQKRKIRLERESTKTRCGKNRARWVDSEGYYEGNPFWCEECLEKMESDEEESGEYDIPEFLLPVCNSPRMGVCGYEGSDIYPDQFEPDKE